MSSEPYDLSISAARIAQAYGEHPGLSVRSQGVRDRSRFYDDGGSRRRKLSSIRPYSRVNRNSACHEAYAKSSLKKYKPMVA